MTKVVITAGGGVTAHDIFSIYLCGDGYMLANGETKDIFWAWKTKAVSKSLVNMAEVYESKGTDRAVFGDMIIFSLRGNCCHSFGLRTSLLAKPGGGVRRCSDPK